MIRYVPDNLLFGHGCTVHYYYEMDIIREIAVNSLDAAHRQALDNVIGAQLQANQRLIITVTDITAEEGPVEAGPVQTLEDWTNVYEGLSDEEIDEIHKIVNTRDHRTRDLP